METYIDRIKLLKAERKMTNDVLAQKTGIPLGTLSKILAGMSESPKLSTVVAICGALGCTVEYIVNGTPENTNNYTLDKEEISFVEDYRRLDSWGKETVEAVLEKECQRVGAAAESAEEKKPSGKILRPIATGNRYAGEQPRTGRRSILLFELPVSAGVGVYLDEDRAEKIKIPDSEKTMEADYALRISGNSMEPKYHNGDVLLVQNTDSVEVGELGIFLLDGCGFFKQYGGDRLISLNQDYGPILLKDFSDVQCKGKVIGKLKKKA